LKGVNIGRGALIGSGTVCRKSVPPYAIVMGNPAKVVGFKFRPDEIVEHERLLYPEDERLDLKTVMSNYQKHFIDRIQEIRRYIQ
ncbi:hypothetical protein OAI06_03900, partial [Schleiferiaceae bacterium]|nr:hypothetical protein [Schleiferiaceae bacterium]